jgi:hypothetical protein
MDASDLFSPKAPDKESGGIFGSGKKVGFFGSSLTEVSGQVNNVSRRLRILEERYLNIRKKTQLTEQNMIQTNKKLIGQIRDAFNEILEIRGDIKKINEQITVMNSELQDCANRNDLLAVDKYVEFWEPMNFLTEEQARKLIDDVINNRNV